MSETREAKRLRELAEGSRKLEPEDLVQELAFPLGLFALLGVSLYAMWKAGGSQ